MDYSVLDSLARVSSFEVRSLLIDRTHRVWMVVSGVVFAMATAAFVVYARSAPDGPQGGSVPGLLFGIFAAGLMVGAGLLSARKRFPRARLGSAAFWLRGHIWLGLLSGPMVLYHAGFQWGGLLEQVIVMLTVAIIVSGVFGLLLQQIIPRAMASAIPAEAMFDQLPAVCLSLRTTADRAVSEACGAAAMLAPAAQGDDPKGIVAGFYRQTVRPFLELEIAPSPLETSTAAATLFGQVRTRVPEDLQVCLVQLSRLCDERRQLLTQARLHRWLHGWLLLHVPLSAALLVLGLAHAVMAMWY